MEQKLFKNMKNIILNIVLILILMSCGSGDKGELVGVKGKKYFAEKPFGMALIAGGSFIMGKSDDDLVGIEDAPTKTVTVRSFYMDETEITNSEYRQFVYWVRDSIIRTKLAEEAEYSDADLEGEGIAQYAYKDTDTTDLSVYQKWKKENTFDSRPLNWDVDLIFDRNDYPDDTYLEVVEGMFMAEDEVFNNVRSWDVKQFKFEYKDSRVADYLEVKEDLINQLATDNPPILNPTDEELEILFDGFRRSNFITDEVIEVYPDTTVWITDFKYSYNEPMHNDYFWHDAYSEYPVVGVSWEQAKAFAHWRTMYKNKYQKSKSKNDQRVASFRLPSEAEWEYAARGGIESGTYPWGGPYTTDAEGCFLANFKPNRGDYAADNALYTVEAKSYWPNDYGLYNMSGNVSEWTESSYDKGSYTFDSGLNPNISDSTNLRKVTRGGSWKDVAYFLRVSTRDYEYKDQKRSYVGFRTVQDYLGEDIGIDKNQNKIF